MSRSVIVRLIHDRHESTHLIYILMKLAMILFDQRESNDTVLPDAAAFCLHDMIQYSDGSEVYRCRNTNFRDS
jgi:hypothetical protein